MSQLAVAMSEEGQVAIDFQEIGMPECEVLLSESRVGKAPEGFGSRMSLASAVSLLVCCCHFSLVSGMV